MRGEVLQEGTKETKGRVDELHPSHAAAIATGSCAGRGLCWLLKVAMGVAQAAAEQLERDGVAFHVLHQLLELTG